MSYDVSLCIIDAKGAAFEVAAFNYTSNVAGMWIKAGAQIHEWNGRKARWLSGELETAISRIHAALPEYRQMNPETGWGDCDGMLRDFLEPLLDKMERFPDAEVRVTP